ncbi:hypothetical protein BLNAU_14854 [Blattamonas nauphoetae]|uniref:Uncharacterized protein n=1 Tax=Blattamonas nauphoetae TaxID=2049346 RepID=A0ABQ9XCD4_9EUKA|nr:hypothetical protein BLNAU_14854 [Blattamonas nauphoetae]
MENEAVSSNTTNDVCLFDSPEAHPIVNPLQEPFLNFDPISNYSSEDKSTILCSLVALVKAEYPFDDTLQDRAAQFLKNLGPQWGDEQPATKLVTELVHSSAGSPSGFVESITTLLSSPHSMVVAAAWSVIYKIVILSSLDIRCCLVESDLVSKVLVAAQPQTLPISENETIIDNLIWIIFNCINLATQPSVSELGITAAVDQSNHREMIFRKVVFPSSQFVTFLITNRHVLNGDLFKFFMYLLCGHIRICPLHRPTLEYVLASPIAMALSSCLSFIERNDTLWTTLLNINQSLEEWKKEGPEVVQSAKRMTQALIVEGFEDTLEQMLLYEKSGYYSKDVVESCDSISQLLGSNVKNP